MKNKNDKIIENKVALSFREYENKKVLFRLFNNKRDKSKSFLIYEKSKFSTTIKDAFNNDYRKVDIEYDTTKFSSNIKDAFNNDYRKVDIEYDTTKNNRFKKVNLLIDLNSYLDKSKKNLYLDLINSNKEFIKKNKVDNSIIENIKFFEDKIKSL
jgi:hypothetical protein